MKKIILFVLFSVFAISLFAQEQDRAFTVAVWVSHEKDIFKERALNEIERSLITSEEFYFVMEKDNSDNADFHLVLRSLKSGDFYIWALGITPINDPTWTNTFIFWTEDSISGMNWAARHAVQKIEEMLYLMLDYYTRGSLEDEA